MHIVDDDDVGLTRTPSQLLHRNLCVPHPLGIAFFEPVGSVDQDKIEHRAVPDGRVKLLEIVPTR